MTKKCCTCEQLLDLTYFYAKGKNRLQSNCKKCLCKKQSERWIRRKIEAIQGLGGQCYQCGYKRNYAALDFHHRNPTDKEFQWQRLRLRPWPQVLLELDKCDLLCKNCHQEKHYPEAILLIC